MPFWVFYQKVINFLFTLFENVYNQHICIFCSIYFVKIYYITTRNVYFPITEFLQIRSLKQYDKMASSVCFDREQSRKDTLS